MSDSTDTATVAGGCFWCVEAALKRLEGVETTTVGYAGGHLDDPSYEAVCRGDTGHAEAVQIQFDPHTLAYDELLAGFFAIHDPTTKNRQGPDVGTQYRSAIFYHSPAQQSVATDVIAELTASGKYDGDIVTELAPLERFWPAEEYHQNYYEKQTAADGTIEDAYCAMYVPPKIDKLRRVLGEKMH